MSVASGDSAQHVADECFRCGYDIRGIENDRPCPECGLITARSRRLSDELHDTRPRWLRRISLGVWSMLLAVALVAAMPLLLMAADAAYFMYQLFGFRWLDAMPVLLAGVAVVLLIVGVFLLTSREGYGPADQADAWRRKLLRALAVLLPVVLVLAALEELAYVFWSGLPWTFYRHMEVLRTLAYLLAFVVLPLPLLLFYQLRSLARRARSAHLAEHCAIVGIGSAAAVAYILLLVVAIPAMERWMADPYWLSRSNVALGVMLVASVGAALFVLWALYLLVRFAIAFHQAARQLRAKWKRDDLSEAAG